MLEIKVDNDTKIAVIGDIHEHPEQFNKLLKDINPSSKTLLVSVGDVYDKGFGQKAAEEITNQLISLKAYVVQGNHEIKNFKKARRNNQITKQLAWWKNQPLAISFLYPNQSRVTIVHGGVLPVHTWSSLGNDIEVCYVRSVDENGRMIRLNWSGTGSNKKIIPEKNGFTWHDMYDGRFGYIASGHDAQKDGVPKFYNYSCNLDTACYETGTLTAQIFSSKGREELVQATGVPFRPELNYI